MLIVVGLPLKTYPLKRDILRCLVAREIIQGGGWGWYMEVSFCCSFLLLSCGFSPWPPQGCPCPVVGTSTGRGPFRGVPAPVWRVSFQKCISSCVHNSCPLLHASLCLFEHSVMCLLLHFFAFAATGSFSLSQINWRGGTVCSSRELEDGRQQVHGASWNWPWPTQGSSGPPPTEPLLPKPLFPVHSCASWEMLEERSYPCLIVGTPLSFHTLRNKSRVLSCSLLSSNNVLCH